MPQFIPLIIWAVLMIASYIIAQSNKPNTDSGQNISQDKGHLLNTCETDIPLPLIYGRVRVGMNKVYKAVTNQTFRLHIIGNICEGEIKGIAQDDDGVDQLWIDDKLWNDKIYRIHTDPDSGAVTIYNSVYYEVFTGSANQEACAALHAAVAEWNEPKRHTAYLYARIIFDANVFQAEPEITLEVEGLLLYDPRTGDTSYSNNPALCARDFIVRTARRGGMGISTVRLSDNWFISAANYCDAKGWTCNLPVNQDQAATDNLTEILSCFRGMLVDSAGGLRLLYRDLDYESSVMAITEEDVIDDDGSTLEIEQPSVFQTPNAVRVKYLNKEKKFQTDDYVKADPDAREDDGGDYREETVTIRGIDNQATAMRMANYHLERLRVNKSASFTGRARLMRLECGDLATLTHRLPGWEDQLVRVESMSKAQGGGVALVLSEEYEAFYDDTYNLSDFNWHDTNLPSPSDPVPAVENVSHYEEVYYYRNRSYTRWKIDFTRPDVDTYPFWDHADIWVKAGEDDTWHFMTTSRGNYMIDPVNEGVTYSCKMVSVSIHGVKQDFNEAPTVSRYIIGKTTLPTSLAAVTAVADGDNVNIFAQRIDDPDIEGYEVRMGSSWTGGILIGFNSAPMVRLSGVKPGTYTFWMSPRDNAGQYAANPASATVTIFYPGGYADKNTWSWDFSTGTLANTEKTTYGGNNVLKCSHTAGALSGTWTSPEYDLGSIKTVRVWGDFITDFASSALTWAGIVPSPNAWSAIMGSDDTWADVFSAGGAGQLRARLEWGTLSGTYPYNADFFEILAAEITARYVRVIIEIIDPAIDANLYCRTLNMKAAYWA